MYDRLVNLVNSTWLYGRKVKVGRCLIVIGIVDTVNPMLLYVTTWELLLLLKLKLGGCLVTVSCRKLRCYLSRLIRVMWLRNGRWIVITVCCTMVRVLMLLLLLLATVNCPLITLKECLDGHW